MFRTANWGVLVVDPETGDTLYSRNAGKLFMPASNQKLLTGATALAQLGPDFRFVTRFASNGPQRDSVLDGDLVVIGRGDPTFSDSMRAGDYRNAFRDMADSVAAARHSPDPRLAAARRRRVSGFDVRVRVAGGRSSDLVGRGRRRVVRERGPAPGRSQSRTWRHVSRPGRHPRTRGRIPRRARGCACGTEHRARRNTGRARRASRLRARAAVRAALSAALGDPRANGQAVAEPDRGDPLQDARAREDRRREPPTAAAEWWSGSCSGGERQPDGFAVRDGSGMSRHDYVTPETIVRVLDAMRKGPRFPGVVRMRSQ